MSNLTSWVDVDLDALSNNVKIIKDFIGKTKMLAVVKADAYGHGIVPVAFTAIESGADYIGVSNIDEGILLRKNGIEAPILVFNTILPEQAEKILQFDLTATVCSLDVVQALHEEAKRLNIRARIHIKVDTGLGRFGILPEHAPEFIRIISTDFKSVDIEGIYTHFSAASSESITRMQFNKFQSVTKAIQESGFNIPLSHACNSIATVKYPEMHLDMVRTGNLMYGLSPAGNLNIKKVAGVFSRIIFIKNLPKGHNIGYGNKYTTKRPTTVAVIPFGYYDGLELQVSQPSGVMEIFRNFLKQLLLGCGIIVPNGKVKIRGRTFNIIGKISMQNCMIDVTDLKDDILIGEQVELNTRKVNLCFNLPRVYHKDKDVFIDFRQPTVNFDTVNHYYYERGSERFIG